MILNKLLSRQIRYAAVLSATLIVAGNAFGQRPSAAAVERGSQTAKQGFKNEDEIRDKFNNWRADTDAESWLGVMGFGPAEIESVVAAKPHGEKADVEVRIKT